MSDLEPQIIEALKRNERLCKVLKTIESDLEHLATSQPLAPVHSMLLQVKDALQTDVDLDKRFQKGAKP